MRYGRGMRRLALLAAAGLLTGPAAAQLINERVEGTSRICTYYGSDRAPNDTLVPRAFIVGYGQSCPAVAPVRDENAPPPPNAQLTGETVENGERICLFEQAGLTYRIGTTIDRYCAQTPALQAQQPRSTNGLPRR
jgi:hypothetical protein